MRQNIFAFTAPGSLPPYVSVNTEESGSVELSVRSPTGILSYIDLTPKQAEEMARAILGHLESRKPT